MPADYIVCGDYVVTMNANCDVINKGAVAVKDKTIVAVGTAEKLFHRYPDARVIGGKGYAVMPGLINTHNHAPMVYLRGIADDLPLNVWLEQHIWPIEKKYLSPSFVYNAVELACLEMLKGGTTTFVDFYFFGDSIARAAKNIGLRAIIGEVIFEFPTATANDLAGHLHQAQHWFSQWAGDDLITPAVAPHAPYTCSPDAYKKSQALAIKYNVPMMTHVAETNWEVNAIKERYGTTPVRHLEKIGALDHTLLAAHCVWLDDAEIAILAKHKVGVAHCAQSNLKLASGFAPIPKMLRAGVRVGIGTDGAASNNDLNMFGEMSSVAMLHKAVSQDPTVLDAKTVLLMATRGGAESIGFDKLGYLEKDCRADIITLDINKPHSVPLYDIHSHIVYGADVSDVSDVMVNGRVLMRKRMPLTCDEEGIFVRAHEWGQKIAA